MGQRTEEPLHRHWRCLIACFLVAMCPFQYGLDFGLIGGLQAMVGFLKIFGYKDPATPVGWNIQPTRQQLIASLMVLGSFIGSASAGPVSVKLGRKHALWIACVLCWASDAIMMGSTSIGGLYVARLFIGIANGFFMTFSQLYLQEVSPARYRGMAIAAFDLWISIGSLVGTIVDNFTSTYSGRNCYLIPLGVILILPVIVFCGMFFIPESPRWLAQQGRYDDARKSLDWLRPRGSGNDRVEDELRLIITAIEVEKEQGHGVTFKDLFANPVDRRRTFLSIACVTLQAASGAMYMISYGTYFFEMAAIGNAFENSCILVGVGVAIMLINALVISSIGQRRVFLFWGLLLCGLCQVLIAIVYSKIKDPTTKGKAIVGLAVIFLIGYNGCVSTYAWVAGGEIPSQRLRSYTFGLAAAIGFLGAWLTTFTAPYFLNPAALNWGPKYGYIWVASCVIAAAFVWMYVPETKNRTLEEIDEMFEARLPARKFKGYVCKGFEEVAHKDGVAEKIDTAVQIEEVQV